MGSPQNPSKEQTRVLEKAGGLAMVGGKKEIKVTEGKSVINLQLESQATVLLKFDWLN
ncbi:hypothetical protein [Dyadobacter sp. 3J3]|uniref:hypothetical protein n=1 Tax=Dyadobacter sp. 3J3 TaxID=2606600 RepID=UPI001E33A6C4|nr:hypothetical protein [Dyadobacter sp. 3J3]